LLEVSQKVARNSQKVAQNFLQRKSKVAPCNESCSNVAKKAKTYLCIFLPPFGLMQKYDICSTKVTFLSIFVQFCVVTSGAN